MKYVIAIVLSALTLYCAEAKAQEVDRTIVEPPTGYTLDGDKCYSLDEYKDLAVIITRYEQCEVHKQLLVDLAEGLKIKYAMLQDMADSVVLDMEEIEAEREALLIKEIEADERIALEKRRVKVWKVLAICGGIAALAFGATTTTLALAK